MKIFHDQVAKQINFLDERFYTLDDITFYPSVTTVLEAYPKGYGFNQWLKDLGMNADEVLRRAGEQGSRVHDACDRYINGERISWTDAEGKEIYTMDEWLMILKFVEFYTAFRPEKIANEIPLVSPVLRIGGTLDFVGKMNNQVWLIDYKSSNNLWPTHELQLSAYSKLWNEYHPDQPIERWGILWLKASTRGPDKAGKSIQGKGWQLKEYERSYEDAFRIFEHTHAIWDEEYPTYRPKNMVYPDYVKLGELDDPGYTGEPGEKEEHAA